jgi:hypothetical protein
MSWNVEPKNEIKPLSPEAKKVYAWSIATNSGIFPSGKFRITKLDNITEAVLEGTIFENKIVPPPTVTEDIIAVMEAATLLSGPNAAALSADLRAMLEKGEYSRRLAKIGKLDEMIQTAADDKKIGYILSQMTEFEKIGMKIVTKTCEIQIKTTTSWIISSASFGSHAANNKSLLSMGDLNRFRWRSYLPSRDERLQITSEVGSLPPVICNSTKRTICNEAWITTIDSLRKLSIDNFAVPRDEQSYLGRKNSWDEMIKEAKDKHKKLESETYYNQIVNMRTRAEFTRLMYQHAALKQFARDTGTDCSFPEKFIIDYKEDGEFAKTLCINEYKPTLIDVIHDIVGNQTKAYSCRITKTTIGEQVVLERLKTGHAKRDELVKLCEAQGISQYTLDNQILPYLLNQARIKRLDHGSYALLEQTQPTSHNNQEEKPKNTQPNNSWL